MQNALADAITREKFNTEITALARETESALQANVAFDTGALEASISSRTKKFYGQIDRISFPFLRYGVFRAKGAGKGYGGSKGSTWYNAKGEKKSTNPESFGKMSTGNREGDDWYAIVIEEQIPRYEDVTKEYYGELVVNAIKL